MCFKLQLTVMSVHQGIRLLPEGEVSVALVGESAVGKTEIARVCQSGHAVLDPGEKRPGIRHTPTVGIEPFMFRTHHGSRGTVWDISAGSTFRHMVAGNVRWSKVVCIVFDLTNRETFDKVQYWYDLVSEEKKNPCAVLVGNKSDLASGGGRQVRYQEATDLADHLGMGYFECSAAVVTNVLDLMQMCCDRYHQWVPLDDDGPTDLDISLDDSDIDEIDLDFQEVKGRSWCLRGSRCILM